MRRFVVGLAIAFATLTPTWVLANDQQIAQQIIQKLEQQKQAGQLKGFGIDLQVDDGTVFMNGRVSTPEQQQMALGIAQRTPGVKQVVNGLKVQAAAAPAAPVARPEAKPTSQSSLMGGFGNSMKKAFVKSEQARPEAQQVAAVEPVTQSSVMKSAPAPAPRTAAAYNAPAGTGVRAVSTPPRVQQSQYVAGQEALGTPVAAQPVQVTPRPLQSQLQPVNPVARATMPGHTGPGRPQQMPVAYAPARTVAYNGQGMAMAPMAYGQNAPVPTHVGGGVGVAPARYDHPHMPGYAWPSYAAYPNYAAVTYPKQYSPTAWPYIGPFYPYPQVPLGWRKVTLEWDDGWWMLDFKDQNRAWKPHR